MNTTALENKVNAT